MSDDKPALGGGYAKIVNELLEGLAAFPLSSLEHRMVFAIIRKTYGFNKAKDRIAASQLAEIMGVTRQKASSTLAGLIRKNVVIREGGAQAPIKINTKTEQWVRPQKGTRAPENPNVNRNQNPVTENGSLNPNTVRNTNPNTVHTKDRIHTTSSPSENSSEHASGHSPDSPPPENPPAKNLKPDAAVQSPSGRQWGYAVDVELAELMATTIDQRLGQDAPARRNMLTWANEIRLMRERDNRPVEAIRALFAWSQQHTFWRSNILSPGKLRDQWPTLAAQRNEERQRRQGGNHEARWASSGAGDDVELSRQQTDFEYAMEHFD